MLPNSNDNFDILVRFVLDEQAQARVQKGISTINEELINIGNTSGSRTTTAILTDMNKKIDEVDRGLDRMAQKRQEHKRQIENERKAIEKYNQTLIKQSSILQRVSSDLQRFSTGLFAGGTAIVAGIVLEANRFAKEAGNATAVTAAWNKELVNIRSSQRRIDDTLAQEALPLLQKAAQIANIASRFIQQNPDIINAALKLGAVTAGLGALGIAVSKGIKLYADATYIIASAAQVRALEANTAALLGKGALGSGAGGAGLLSLGALGPIIASVLASAAVITASTALYNKFSAQAGVGTLAHESEKRRLDDAVRKGILTQEEANKRLAAYDAEMGKGIGIMARFNAAISGKSGKTVGVSTNVSTGAGSSVLGNSLSDFQVQTTLDIRAAYKDLNELTANYSASISSITQDYLQQNAQAEAQYAQQRAQIVRDGGIEIQRIEQDSQRRLAKMALEHEDKMYSLALARDALGLVQEQRDYERQKQEEEDNTNLEIKRRRQDIALRLSDLAKSYAQERKMRLQQYQQQIYAAQKEFEARRSALQAQIRDLIYALTHEREVKAAYYQAIINDAASFANAYRATLASAYSDLSNYSMSGGDSGLLYHQAAGGYANFGKYVLGDLPSGGPGPREFVMSGRTTRAAEQMLGGPLTQGNLLSALSGAGLKGGINIIDNSRYLTSTPANDRRKTRLETARLIMDISKR